MTARQPDIVCPECGSSNPAGSIHCAECGFRLANHGQAPNLWRRASGGSPSRPMVSSQATTPFEPIPSDPTAPIASPSVPPPRPPMVWPLSTPGPMPSQPPRTKPSGPSGCVLGGLAVLIIAIVAALFAWSIARPYVRGRVGDRITSGVSTQVSEIGVVTVTATGKITLTQDEVNTAIKGYSGSLDPISDPVATLNRTGVHVKFTLYGTTSEFSALPVAAGGKIVLLKPKISGVAGQFVDAGQLATVIEQQLAALMARSNLTPASVTLIDGALIINTNTGPSAAGNSI